MTIRRIVLATPPRAGADRRPRYLTMAMTPSVIIERARELVREAEQREDERHDEYDDPDQGGEA
jgi:hypothetical protein